MKCRPVVAELQLRDPRRRDRKRPEAVETKSERFENQDARGHAVGDQAHGLTVVLRAQLRQASEHPLADLVERLGTRADDQVGGLAPHLVRLGEPLAHLRGREPLPGAEAHLLECRALRHREALRLGYRGRRVPRPAQGTRPDGGQALLRQEASRRLGLGAPALGQRGVRPALIPALPVPVRLGVPNEQEPERHHAEGGLSPPRSVKTFCAARTAAPKSTGYPISWSTCSSAASAVSTSKSPTYPMWPRRKTFPFISPCPPAIVMLCDEEYAARIASLSTPFGATTAVSAGLGWVLANNSSPSASAPERVARASRSWRLKTLGSPSASSMRSTSRRPSTIETAGVKCASFFATALCSAAM